MHPRLSGQKAPFRIPDLFLDPHVLEIFVGLSVGVDRLGRSFILEFISNPFTLLRDLVEELVVRT